MYRVRALLVLVALATAQTAGADFTPLDAVRSVSVIVDRNHNTAPPEHFEDQAVGIGTEPFDATVSVPEAPGNEASQTSSIGPLLVQAVGSRSDIGEVTGAAPGWGEGTQDGAETSSSFELRFRVGQPRVYTLTGSVGVTGTWVSEQSESRIVFTGPSGEIGRVELVADQSTCEDPVCELGPAPLSLSGLLGPGDYVLQAESLGISQGSWAFGYSIEPFGDGAYDLTLTLAQPVPALEGRSRAVLAFLLALAVVLLGRPRSG